MSAGKLKAAVVTFPGANCDDDTFYTFGETCGWTTERLWHKESPDLSSFDLVALPGGFSYGDYLRCGAIASLSPILESVKSFAAKGGKVIGICNGFQVLCEAGLLPGALSRNNPAQFFCQDVWVRVENNSSPWTKQLEVGDTLKLPIAHSDGRYIVDEKQYQQMLDNEQIILRYSSSDGNFADEYTPNGSTEHIAGICNKEKNVFGLMPHPERASDLRSGHGMGIWKSLENFIANS